MNDAKPLDSSLTGAIDFFQSLHRKLGTLETDASTQHDQMHTLSDALVTLEQDRKTDRQMVANLSSDLVKMQADGRLLEQQLNAVETRVAGFQQDQQQVRQTLSAVADDLRTQGADWRQELAATLTQRLAPIDELIALEQTARRQLQTQQGLLDALTASSTVAEKNLQVVQQDIADMKGEFETQHRMQGDIAQIQQELQKHRDRLKHLETLISKVSADTNSTRQILNVIQGDLTTQNDTLRELDQNWCDSLGTYQDRLSSVEMVVAGGSPSATRLTQTPELLVAPPEPALAPPSVEYERFETLETAFTTTRDQYYKQFEALQSVLANTLEQHQTLERELSDVQTTLQHQDEHFAELHSTLTGPWDAVQQRIGELETAFESLHQSLETPVQGDTDAALEKLRQAIADQSAALEETQQLAWAQIQDLQQRLSEAEATLDSSSQTPESATTDIDTEALGRLREDLLTQIGTLDEFRETLSTQSGTLDEFRETTQQQLTDLTATLDVRQQDFQDAVNQIANLQQDVRQLQQQPAPDQALDPQRLETAELYAQEVRQDLDTLQESVTALEARLSSQSQAFSGNFEQFRNMNADIQALQQQMARLDASPRQLGVFEQELATHEQEINQLKEIIEQVQADSQQMGDAIQQRSDSPLTEVATRLDEQQERWTELTTAVETLRADSKASQETVVTMATNVAKRIHEIQNLLVATESTQSERLQEVEQKLIHLQAAFETLENQRKPRKWFSMPASITSIMLTVGVSSLAILAQVIWTLH